ncbi:hypothetical protein AAC387_Pa01g4293 [Persea americana]
MFLGTKPTLLMRAPHIPCGLKKTTVTAAREHPRTIGRIESQTVIGQESPRKDEKTTLKTGSEDLMTWVKETATLENETQAEMWPMIRRHIIISLEFLLKLLKIFGPVINSTVSSSSPIGVDLQAEERRNHCTQCFVQLQKIKQLLPAVIR